MVTGLTYLPVATSWWKDNKRNTAENILAATDAIYRIILLLLFAGVDIKLADLLGVSIYADSDFSSAEIEKPTVITIVALDHGF
jgi:hypothetical protein